MLGRLIAYSKPPKTEKAEERTPWPAFDLMFRAPPVAHIAWALMRDEHRAVLELRQGIAQDKKLLVVAAVPGSLVKIHRVTGLSRPALVSGRRQAAGGRRQGAGPMVGCVGRRRV
ncbi:hypothetical protein [Streptomyces malaysiense]|uniref:Uncharacterized protein n=1 Tax=Streptomyces malaysiense TaxID=1428626 RepID=A0A1J4PS02_9ACTN|nr:hypothetical protein VT52_031175 [Streptomyces malaysiense]